MADITKNQLHELTTTMKNVVGDDTKANDLMDSVEPYDYSKLVPFEEAYLTGYVADRFDSDPDEELPRASRRTILSTIGQMSDTTSGFLTVTRKTDNLEVDKADVKYVFLPVYLLNCEYEGKKYRYAVNGQTGKVVGELPISKKKLNKKFFLTFAITTAISFAAMLGICMVIGG